MKIPTTLLLCALIAVPLHAQQPGGGFGDYTFMEIPSYDELKGNFVTGLRSLKGNVEIILSSENPTIKPLTIRCEDVQFTYDPDSSDVGLTQIILQENVYIDHPQGTVHGANKAIWSLQTNTITFTGNPILDSAQVKGLQGDTIILDFAKNDFQVLGKGSLQQYILGKPQDPALLTLEDITNWTALLAALQTQANDEAPSPGKHLVSLIEDPNTQKSIRLTPINDLVNNKKDILKLLNKTLENPNFYNAQAFQGINLPQEAKDLLAAGKLPEPKQTQLNRLLLEAAFPQAFN